MKYAKKCPKCGSKDIKRLEKVLTGGGLLGSEALGTSMNFWGSISSHFEAFVCAQCGFTEFYMPKKYLD